MSQSAGGSAQPLWFDPAGVREVARRAVQSCAADEVDVFDAVADEFFARRRVSLRGGRSAAGSAAVRGSAAMSSAALTVATAAAHATAEAPGSAGGLRGIARRWRSLRPVKADPNAPVPAPVDRVAALAELVTVAVRTGLSEAQATQVAAAVLAEVPTRP